MRRELGVFETAAVLSNEHAPFTVVAVLEFDGGPSPDRLERALSILQREQPLLGVRIVPEGRRYFFESDANAPIPLRIEEPGAAGHWLELVEHELNAPLDSGQAPLLRCTYLMPSALVLSFHHAIMDGVSGTRLLRRLVELLDREQPEPAQAPADELPPPAETLFPPAWRGARGGLALAAFIARQAGDEISFRVRRRGCRLPSVAPGTRCRPFSVGLPRDETAALVRAARRRRVSLNSALNAALLLAVQRRLYDGHAAPMRYMTFANLRPYLAPPVSDRQLAGCISFLRYTVDVAAAAEFWELTRRISGQIENGLRRGDKFCSARMAERVMRASLGQSKERMAAVAVSYGGAVRLDAADESAAGGDAVRVRALHGFISNFDVGPEYTAQARLFGGELVLDIVYLESDMDETLARLIAADILDTLGTAAERSES